MTGVSQVSPPEGDAKEITLDEIVQLLAHAKMEASAIGTQPDLATIVGWVWFCKIW